MKYCPYCGAKLQDVMIFCPKCGKRYQGAAEDDQTETGTSCAQGAAEEAEATAHGAQGPAEPQASAQPAAPLAEEPAAANVAAPAQPDTPAGYAAPAEPAPHPPVYYAPAPAKAKAAVSPAAKKRRLLVAGLLLGLVLLLAVGYAFGASLPGIGKAKVARLADSVLYLEAFDDSGALLRNASGFLIEDGTMLVTNYHVIERASKVTALTADGDAMIELSDVLAYDEQQDLAILLCEPYPGITPLPLGNSDSVKQGDEIYAVGYPLGLTNTVSSGIISAHYTDHDVDTLQLTAPISSGSSGGALLSREGKLIGVICASYLDGQNLNLAVASNTLAQLVSRAGSPVALSSLHEPAITVEYLLENYRDFDGQYVYVTGYLSSALAETSIFHRLTGCPGLVEYHLVSSPDEMYGYYYDDQLYEFDELQYFFQRESERCEQFGSVEITREWKDRLSYPDTGPITFYGKVTRGSRGCVELEDCEIVS